MAVLDRIASGWEETHQQRAIQGIHGVYGNQAAVTEQGPQAMAVDIAAIAIHMAVVNGTVLGAVGSGSVNITTAHATLPRRDVIWVNTSGTFGVTDGTPAAESTSSGPALATPGDDRHMIAEVRVPAGATVIATADIEDRRVYMHPIRIRKASDETVNNSATLQNDDDFAFPVLANEEVAVELRCRVSILTASDFEWTWTMPAGASTGTYHLRPNVGGTPTSQQGAFTPGTGVPWLNGTTVNEIVAYFVLKNGSTAGTATFQWAQDTAVSEDTKILADSILIAHRV